MTKNEIYAELQMTYDDLIIYLLNKYGGAPCDYFPNVDCRKKSKKVTRTSEGLYCHHMDEDKGGNLSNPPQARLQPFAWQKKERLVYCNILEHLILHMKIAVLRQKRCLYEPSDVDKFFTTHGIMVICECINDMYLNDGTSLAWIKRCYEEIKDNYQDYIDLVKAFFTYIDQNYVGKKNDPEFLNPGSIAHIFGYDYEILQILDGGLGIVLKVPTGEERAVSSDLVQDQFHYVDAIDIAMKKVASTSNGFSEKMYNDFKLSENRTVVNDYCDALRVDFNGYGFAQYAGITLQKGEYGAENADEYISKGLPMYSNEIYDIDGKVPIFWKGPKIPSKASKSFYLVRIEVDFEIKKGEIPFVRYREKDSWRRDTRVNEISNLKDRGYTVLESSRVFSRVTGRQIQNMDSVVLTLGREDFQLFKERYTIRHLKILDGCYFVNSVR